MISKLPSASTKPTINHGEKEYVEFNNSTGNFLLLKLQNISLLLIGIGFKFLVE